MMLLTARKRAFGPEQLAAGQVCRLSDLWRHAQPATLVDFRGSSLSDAGSIPAISTRTRIHGWVRVSFRTGSPFEIIFDSCHLHNLQKHSPVSSKETGLRLRDNIP